MLDEVRARWTARLHGAGLESTLGPQGWQARWTALRTAEAARRDAALAEEQATGMRQAHDRWRAEVHDLADRHGTEPGLDGLAVLTALGARLETADQARRDRTRLVARQGELAVQAAARREELAETSAVLDAVRAEAGVADEAALLDAVTRGEQVAQRRTARAHALTVVAAAVPGEDAERLVQELAGADADALAVELAAAEAAVVEREVEQEAAAERSGELRQELGRLESGTGAAELHARAQEQLAAVAEAARALAGRRGAAGRAARGARRLREPARLPAAGRGRPRCSPASRRGGGPDSCADARATAGRCSR